MLVGHIELGTGLDGGDGVVLGTRELDPASTASSTSTSFASASSLSSVKSSITSTSTTTATTSSSITSTTANGACSASFSVIELIVRSTIDTDDTTISGSGCVDEQLESGSRSSDTSSSAGVSSGRRALGSNDSSERDDGNDERDSDRHTDQPSGSDGDDYGAAASRTATDDLASRQRIGRDHDQDQQSDIVLAGSTNRYHQSRHRTGIGRTRFDSIRFEDNTDDDDHDD